MNFQRLKSISQYAATPLMTAIGFLIASVVFTFVLKIPDPVPVFIIFASVQVISMFLYAVLPKKGKQIPRQISMFLIGTFIFALAGLLGRVNFQLEGFFFYLTTGTVSGVLIHFAMAKLVGPIFFGRGWCSWGCWTAMVLDLLPYKKNTTWKKGALPQLRYIHFGVSLLLVLLLFYVFRMSVIHSDPAALKTGLGTVTEMVWFLAGNGIYYVTGILLAIKLKDNRAFCKYVCPLAVFLKAANRFSLVRIKGNGSTCNNCRTCVTHCPMSIDIPKYIADSGRVKSTECIMCMKCIPSCPKALLSSSVDIDFAVRDHLVKN